MRLILKLLAAHWRRHWLRTLIALGAVATSVAMVIAVVGGYDVALARAGAAASRASKALGWFDMVAISGSAKDAQEGRGRMGPSGPAAPMSEQVLQWLRASKDVKAMFECCQAQVESRSSGPMFQTPMYRPGELATSALLGTSSADPPYPILKGTWPNGDKPASPRAEGQSTRPAMLSVAVDKSMLRMLRVDPNSATDGATFVIASQTGRHEVRIGAVLDTPAEARALSGIYVSSSTFKQLTGRDVKTNRVLIDLKDGVSEEDFEEQLYEVARRTKPPIYVQTASDFQAQAARFGPMPQRSDMGFFPLLRDVGMNLSILAAMFIIFTTFSMGLQERTRQLAMLRAIGMTRGQIVAMVAVEAILLATIGWLAGIVGGWCVVQSSLAQTPGPMPGQMAAPVASIDLHVWLWVALGAVTAYGATLLAAVLPAYLAVRRRPLEGMGGAKFLRAPSVPRWLPVGGAALIALNPLTAMTSVIPDPWRTRTALPVSLLAAIVGFALLIPTAIRACEGLFGRVGGLLFGLNRRLLSGQLSANIWRTVGCTTALMVGLGLYVTIQIWGQSMMTAFTIPPRSPDAVVTVFPDGVPEGKLQAVAGLKGVSSAMPMILEHPALGDWPEDQPLPGMFFGRDLIYLGCNVRDMIDDSKGMIAASFVRGDPQEAFDKIEHGQYCLVTDSLYLHAPDRYDVGKPIVLDTVDEPRRTLTYTIAGVVDIQGWHLLTKSAQMRRGLGRVGGIVLVSTDQAKAAFLATTYKTFWFRMDSGADAASLETGIIKIVDPSAKPRRPTSGPASRGGRGPFGAPMSSGGGPPGGMDPTSGMGGRGGGPGGMRGGRPGGPRMPVLDSPVYCRVTDTRAMTAAISQRSEGIIQAMTFYPLLALGLASLAVVGTMMVSVRLRSWEIGILRSLGLTRGQVLRQTLAEGLLIGLLACVMSLLFGLLVSWVGIAASSRSMGVSAPYVIPWSSLLVGIGAAVALCVAASVWPALTAAFRQPLRLLQEGRSTE